MKAICDQGCNKEFELEALEEVKHSNGIIEICFTCPYCNKKYLVCFTDRSIRAKQAKLRQLIAAKGRPKAIGKLQVSIKEEMSNLKAKMLGN